MYDFCTTIRDADLGVDLVVDFECQLDISFGGPLGHGPSIDGVYVNGKSLYASTDHFTKWLAKRVCDAAEAELADGGALYSAVLERECVQYAGLGGNDPDGFLRRAS